MGFSVRSIRLYSSDDNKVYPVPLPENDAPMLEKFKAVNKEMQEMNVDSFVPRNVEKCRQCIYNDFCDRPLAQKEISENAT